MAIEKQMNGLVSESFFASLVSGVWCLARHFATISRPAKFMCSLLEKVFWN